MRLAAAIRRAGIGVEVYPEPKKLGQQLKYADRRGFRWPSSIGGNEWAAGTCQVKELATAQSHTVPLAEVPAKLAELLVVPRAR